MSLKEEELQKIVYNPSLVQHYILNNLGLEESKDSSNPSTPFSCIMEAISVMGSTLSLETKNAMRTKFPVLAQTMDDLFPHLTDEELLNVFSSPGEVIITMSVYAMKLIDEGYEDPRDPNYVQARIPIGTTVNVAGITFTILNPILIKIHRTTKTPYVAMLPSDNPLSYKDIGNLNAEITHDGENNPFITFKLPIKQVTMKDITTPITEGNNLGETIHLGDKYCYSQVLNITTVNGENQTKKIPQIYSSDYLDPSTPQAYIKVGTDKVSYSISNIYTRTNMVSGTMRFVVYETKGDMFLPLESYGTDKYVLSFPSFLNTSDPSIIAGTRLAISLRSDGSLSGGKNAISVDDLKDKLIKNTTGPIDRPVTQHHIGELAKKYGFSIKLVEDLLTHRTFTAYKDLPAINVQSIKALPDIFVNTIKLTLEELRSLYPTAVKKDASVIRSNTVFREKNGQMLLVDPSELEKTKGMSSVSRNNYFRDNKHFYNPFTVVIENENGYSNSRFYSLDMPKISNLRIEHKNLNISNVNVNVTGYEILRLNNGYRVCIEITGDSGYGEIVEKYKNIFFVLHLTSGKIYYKALYDSNYGFWYVDILFDDFVNADDELIVSNANISGTDFYCPLSTKITIYTCIRDKANYDEFRSLIDELEELNVDVSDLSILSKDTISIDFGKRLLYVWNKLYNTYDARKYKRYEEDVYLTYDNDVYKTDSLGNLLFELSEDGSNIQVVKLHSKGEIVVDEEGNQVLKHKKGDVILNNDGEPIIDCLADLVRFIDIIMLEYEFKLTDDLTYRRMMEIMMSYFDKTVTQELPMINKDLLEKTTILYKPNKSSQPVNIISDNVKSTVPYIVKPKITIYVAKNIVISANDKDIYKQKIGSIIVNRLRFNTIKLSDIKNDILNSLDLAISGIKIENMSPNESEIIYIEEGSTQLTLEKVVTFTEYKTNIVTYNVELDFVRLT